MIKYEKGTLGWLKEKAKEHGFGDNIKEYTEWARKNGKLPTEVQVKDKWAQERGYKNYIEYQNHLAQEKGFMNLNDYRNHLVNEKGFRSIAEYNNHLAEKKGFKNKYDEFLSKRDLKEKDYRDRLAQEKGFKDNKEYRNHISQEMGYKDFSEYKKMLKWNKEDCSPMSENKDCSQYLGIHIVEKKIAKTILEMIFEDFEEMPHNNPGFDFKCNGPKQEFIDRYAQFKLERNKE